MTGNTVCRFCRGLKAMNWPAAFVVAEGTGAPLKMNLGPIVPGRIGLIAGQPLPSFGDINGLLPVNAVEPPLEAKKA